jgi:selenocysteine lyase/cysteine desulfurase
MLSRRRFLGKFMGAAVGVGAVRALPCPPHTARLVRPAFKDGWPTLLDRALPAMDGRSAEDVAGDEDFWTYVQNAFTVDRTIINLNNAGVSPSPRVVQDAMTHYLAYSNEAPPYTMWTVLEPQVESVRRELAAEFGCDPEEMAITRNASEALEIVQLGMDLKPGDEVLTTDQDYSRMLTTWDQRVRRDGIVLTKIPIPIPPPSMDDLVSRFERAITPRTRVIHCCHITNLTGQIFPIRDIVALGRSKGIEVICRRRLQIGALETSSFAHL